MRTVVIRISPPKKSGAPFQVELLVSASEELGQVALVSRAKTTIPAALKPEQDVMEPGTDQPLTVARVREIYANVPDEQESNALPSIGTFLYRLIIRGHLKAEWFKLRSENTPQRTIIEIAPHPSLREVSRLPWELMSGENEPVPFFLANDHPILRGAAGILPCIDDWPLRVLTIAAFNPSPEGEEAAESIQAAEELLGLEKLFAARRYDVDYEVLEQPEPHDIIAACEKIAPHVVHFIGHAEGNKEEEGCLKLWIERDQQYINWYVDDIKVGLTGRTAPFVFLNACETADAADRVEANAALGNLADAFVSLGSRAVIGMQGRIPGDLARVFSEHFYTQILNGVSLDVAMQLARIAVSGKRGKVTRRREWSMPTLRLSVLPQMVLPRARPQNRGTPLVPRLVDRVGPRWQIRQTIQGPSPSQRTGLTASPDAVVIVGDQGVGKSHVALCCRQWFDWCGMVTVYIDFKASSVDVLSALRWIRDGRRPELNQPIVAAADSPLPGSAFRNFNRVINNPTLKDDLDAWLATDPTAAEPDKGIWLKDATQPDEEFIAKACEQFRLALKNIATAAQPIVLVLDHIEGLERTTRSKWLAEGLFKPIANALVPNVRLILVMNEQVYKKELNALYGLVPPPTVVTVDLFELAAFERLARGLCMQWSDATYDNVRQNFPIIRQLHNVTGPWKGEVLQIVDQLCLALTPKQP